MNRPGDWNCRACQHHNFQRRDSCQRCGDLRPGEYVSFRNVSAFGFITGPDVRPGDWYCVLASCGAHNFASRSSCFKCGALKDEIGGRGGGFHSDFSSVRTLGYGGAGGASEWKSGDWICIRSGCKGHNFASRIECYKCNAPRESSSKSLF